MIVIQKSLKLEAVDIVFCKQQKQANRHFAIKPIGTISFFAICPLMGIILK